MSQKIVCFFLLLTLANLASANIDKEWEIFKNKYGKKFENVLEETMRKAIFVANKEQVDYFNKYKSEKAGYQMGINHFSDITQDELIPSKHLSQEYNTIIDKENYAEGKKFLENILNSDDDVPDEVDWRKVEGRVTDIKDQGASCLSGWAFAAVGAIEGQLKPRNITLIDLSVQNLIDCSSHDAACNGGLPIFAFQDLAKLGGINDEYSYQYTSRRNQCKFDKTKIVIKVKGGTYLNVDEDKLKKVVAKFGPVAASMNAHHSYEVYKGGIYFESLCKSEIRYLHKNVLIVGYGTDRTKKIGRGDYWIIKNSRGDQWGEDGYMRLARNKNNHCGIATMAVIPIF